jgi:hypothetical protein
MKIDITENLYQKKGFIWGEGQSAFYDLLNIVNKGILDKNYNTMKSFTLYYPQYKNFEIISGSNGYNLKKCDLSISGDVLNSFKNVFKRYINDSSSVINFSGTKKDWSVIFAENQDLISQNKCVKQIHFKKAKINISEKASLYFHLTTTIGNVMPCMYIANISLGKDAFDIVYNKLEKYIENKDGKFDHWIKHICGDEKTGNWLNIFVNDYYMWDFVEIDKKSKTIIPKKTLNPENIRLIDNGWDNFFFETSKAIISRSYRVLNGIKGDFSDNQLKEIKESFNALCAEYEVKERW